MNSMKIYSFVYHLFYESSLMSIVKYITKIIKINKIHNVINVQV